jgi:uncharacterized OB-fold protein
MSVGPAGAALQMRPLPRPSVISAPHWDGAKQGRLMVQRCDSCNHYVFIPRNRCTHCFEDSLRWVESTGRGVIYSYTIIHRAPHPAFETPYCAAVITLEEGWSMLSHVIGAEMDEIAVEKRVRVDFLDLGEAVLPIFRLEQ